MPSSILAGPLMDPMDARLLFKPFLVQREHVKRLTSCEYGDLT